MSDKIRDMQVLSQEMQEKVKVSDYVGGRKTVCYYPDEEIRICNNNSRYYIGNYGTIYSTYSNKKLNPQYDKHRYNITKLTHDKERFNFKIHRLIMQTFNPTDNSEELQVNHIDGCKSNNVYDPDHNRVNLEWVTPQQNTDHAIITGLKNDDKGENNPSAKYNNEEIHKICEYMELGLTAKQIANNMNIDYTPAFSVLLSRIRSKRHWKSISDNFPNI